MITLKKQGIADTVKTLCLGTFMGLASITCMAESSIDVRHLVSEQNILQIKEAKKYLLLPVQDNAPEGKIYFVINNQTVGSVINIRLAREKVDYYVPLDLSAYVGKDLSLDVQGMPESAICWKKMKLSDTFDTTNREKFRPLYHHTPAYGWMNDPNGMFYKDGVYHLYFQHNPYGSTWGNMTWGHSTTTDLVNWKFEGDAITPDAWGSILLLSTLRRSPARGAMCRCRVWHTAPTTGRRLRNTKTIRLLHPRSVISATRKYSGMRLASIG